MRVIRIAIAATLLVALIPTVANATVTIVSTILLPKRLISRPTPIEERANQGGPKIYAREVDAIDLQIS